MTILRQITAVYSLIIYIIYNYTELLEIYKVLHFRGVTID